MVVKDKIISLIKDNFDLEDDFKEIDQNESLLNLGLDSLDIVELSLLIESEFSIIIKDATSFYGNDIKIIDLIDIVEESLNKQHA